MERQKLCEASQQESASHDTQEDIFQSLKSIFAESPHGFMHPLKNDKY